MVARREAAPQAGQLPPRAEPGEAGESDPETASYSYEALLALDDSVVTRGLSPAELARLEKRAAGPRDGKESCTICLGALGAGAALLRLPCGGKHSFHAACVRTWLQRKRTCPTCREELFAS